MRRLAAAVGTVIVMLVLAAPAQAAPISFDYCELSLRGGGSLAPDNDIKIWWDAYENITGQNIVSSSRSGAGYVNGYAQWVQLRFTFFNGAGQPLTTKWFECWREGLVPSGTYHDNAV
jgi:hypothetical protein